MTDVLGQKGSKVYVKGIHEEGNTSGEVGLEYKDKKVALNGSVSKPLKEGFFKVLGAGVIKHNNFSVGGDVEYEHSEKGVLRYSAKGQYDKDDSTFCLFFNDILKPKKENEKPKKELGFSYFFKIRSDLNGALDFKADENKDTELRVGSSLKVDSNTTVKSRMVVKNKQDFRVGLVLKQKITPTAKVAISTDLDTKSLFEDGENKHRFNFALTFGDD